MQNTPSMGNRSETTTEFPAENSILERVKRRLFGDDSPTQHVPQAQQNTRAAPPFEPLKLPQLSLDRSEFFGTSPEGSPGATPPDFTLGSTQIIPRRPQIAVSQSAASRSSEQRDVLQAEITRVSLTDEENDLADDADVTLDSSVQNIVTTKAQLEEIERDLSEKKRLKSIQPVFKKTAVNPVQRFLDAFESESDSPEEINSVHIEEPSPTTSPAGELHNQKKDVSVSDSDSDLDASVLDVLAKPPSSPPAKKKKSPIEEYAQKLKKQLHSLPTRQESDLIVLDESEGESSAEEPDIPKLTREQAFLVKQKFSKKRFNNRTSNLATKFRSQPQHKSNGNLFDTLRRANAKQILQMRESNPDADLIEEIEQEEEEMGNLLEREMERVRRIRKKEKLMEKAKSRLLGQANDGDDDNDGDRNYSDPEIKDTNSESDVPDSEVSDEEYSEDSGIENETSDANVVKFTRENRAKRAVLSDDDENSDFEEPPTASVAQDYTMERNDDSYMFGGQNRSKSIQVDNDDEVMQIHSDIILSESPTRNKISKNLEESMQGSPKLFRNLPPPKSSTEISLADYGESIHPRSMSFHEIPPTQDVDKEDSFVETQVDSQHTSNIGILGTGTQEDLFSENEDRFLSAVNKGRKKIQKTAGLVLNNQNQYTDDDDDDSETQELDEEELKQRLAVFEAKIRRKELKARKKRKEMERRGLKNILEGEAEESDDEWKGIGGVDNEESDQADSEDERMIDNTFNIDLNDESVREKFMEQYQLKDRKELEKLIDDIKNHRLTKRARANRFDIELSDEEDELLLAYRRQKLEEQKQKLLENQKLMQSAKSEKSKAFFDCLQEDSTPVILDIMEPSADEVSESDSDVTASNSTEGQLAENEGVVKLNKKKNRLEESFVQEQLSFLSKTEEDDYISIQREAERQHGLGSDEDVEDLKALKSKCLGNLCSFSGSKNSSSGTKKRSIGSVLTDEDDDDFSHIFKRRSMVTSFKSYQAKTSGQVSTNSFTGVTVSKHYKVASGSKASITYMSKTNLSKESLNQNFKSTKVQELEEKIHRVKKESGIFSKVNKFG